jgi:hypothetical protein
VEVVKIRKERVKLVTAPFTLFHLALAHLFSILNLHLFTLASTMPGSFVPVIYAISLHHNTAV